MTTDDMHRYSLDNFDAAMSRLRDVVKDPSLTNAEFRPLKEALADVQYAVNRILRVNGAITES